MRNHRLALILALCLLWPAMAPAEPTAPAEPAVLTVRELLDWRDAVWAYAATQPLLNEPTATHDPEGADTWLFEYAFGVLEQIRPAPGLEDGEGGAGRIAGIELFSGDIACPRGISVGDPLESVLAAYPNENPARAGSAAYAALYVREDAGDGATGWGWLLRRGRTVEAAQYAAGMPAGDMTGFRVEPTLLYVIEDGRVSAIRASGFADLLTGAESGANLDAVRAVAMSADFVPAPPAESAETGPFVAGDLAFSGLSFADGTPESFFEALGAPREESGEGDARTLTFDEALVEFIRTDGVWRPSALLVMGSTLAGPRGIAIGDSSTSVTALFGGQMDRDTLIYQCEDQTGALFLLTLTFHDDMLTEYLLYRR